jgi:hypothetical protein
MLHVGVCFAILWASHAEDIDHATHCFGKKEWQCVTDPKCAWCVDTASNLKAFSCNDANDAQQNEPHFLCSKLSSLSMGTSEHGGQTPQDPALAGTSFTTCAWCCQIQRQLVPGLAAAYTDIIHAFLCLINFFFILNKTTESAKLSFSRKRIKLSSHDNSSQSRNKNRARNADLIQRKQAFGLPLPQHHVITRSQGCRGNWLTTFQRFRR